jgi:hypothetical protein
MHFDVTRRQLWRLAGSLILTLGMASLFDISIPISILVCWLFYMSQLGMALLMPEIKDEVLRVPQRKTIYKLPE